ncbi:hypothetical protein ABNF65_15755 [Paenibacillus larvae]
MDFSQRLGTIISFDYKPLIDLITEISDLHKKISDEYPEKFDRQLINLKKRQVRHVFEDELNIVQEEFYLLVQSYYDMLKICTINTELEYEFTDLGLRLRIKQIESIVHKLIYYRTGRREEGKVPLNKCLNDFLGFRIFIDGFDHNCSKFNDLCQKISENHTIKKENACKEDYRATHIYFHAGNKAFPWELQIWNKEDENTNEQSHKTHKSKREYIKWPNTYKNSKSY